jgi:phosphate transport system substrate-binding protein
MKKVTFVRAAGTVAATVAIVGTMATSASAASTAKAKEDITVVGSQTTQELIGSLTSAFNAKSTVASITNVDAQPADPGTVAPSDAHCNGGTAITYTTEPTTGPDSIQAPNGSTAGRTALADSVSAGTSCTSVARSTSGPSASDPAGTQAYAFAVDAIDWVALKGGLAPANLTMTQLEEIYSCQVTNWDQVGGKNGAIDLYFPVSGSGIATFFSGMMGFDPRTAEGTGGSNDCSSTAVNQIEQNEATAIPQASAAGAIDIYSGGAWIAQSNGIDTNETAGFNTRTINGKAKSVDGTAAPYTVNIALVKEANVEPTSYQPTSDTAAQGINNLLNFINTKSVDYTGAKDFVGTGSKLCTNGDNSAIKTYGFAPLTKCLLIPEP